jgi:hypothetical protein
MVEKRPRLENSKLSEIAQKVLKTVTAESGREDRRTLETILHLREVVDHLTSQQKELVERLANIYDLLVGLMDESDGDDRQVLFQNARDYFKEAEELILKQFTTPGQAKRFANEKKKADSKKTKFLFEKPKSNKVDDKPVREKIKGSRVSVEQDVYEDDEEVQLPQKKKKFAEVVVVPPEVRAVENKDQNETLERIEAELAMFKLPSEMILSAQEYNENAGNVPNKKFLLVFSGDKTVRSGFFSYAHHENGLDVDVAEKFAEKALDVFKQMVERRKKDFADNGPKALELAEETLSDVGAGIAGEPMFLPFKGKPNDEVLRLGRLWFAMVYEGIPEDEAKEIAIAAAKAYRERNSTDSVRPVEKRDEDSVEDSTIESEKEPGVFSVVDALRVFRDFPKARAAEKYLQKPPMPVFGDPAQAVREAYFVMLKAKNPRISIAEAGRLANEAREQFKKENERIMDDFLSKDPQKIVNTAEFVIKESEEIEHRKLFPEGADDTDENVVYAGAYLFAKHFKAMSRTEAEHFASRVRDEFVSDEEGASVEAKTGSAGKENHPTAEQAHEASAVSPETLTPYFDALDKGDFSTFSLENILEAATKYLSQPGFQEARHIFLKGKSAAEVGIARYWSAEESGVANEADLRSLAKEAREAYSAAEDEKASSQNVSSSVASQDYGKEMEPAALVEAEQTVANSTRDKNKEVQPFDEAKIKDWKEIVLSLDDGDDGAFALPHILMTAQEFLKSPAVADEKIKSGGKPPAFVVGEARYWYAIKVEKKSHAQADTLGETAQRAYSRMEKLQKQPEQKEKTDEEEDEQLDRKAAQRAARLDPLHIRNYAVDVPKIVLDKKPVDEPEVLTNEEKSKFEKEANLKRNYYEKLEEDIKEFTFKKKTGDAAELERRRDAVVAYLRQRFEIDVRPLVLAFEKVGPKNTQKIDELEAQIKQAVMALDKKRMAAAELAPEESLPPEFSGGSEEISQVDYEKNVDAYTGLLTSFHEFIGKFSRIRKSFPDLDRSLKELSLALHRAKAEEDKLTEPRSKEENDRRLSFVAAVRAAETAKNQVLAVVRQKTGRIV